MPVIKLLQLSDLHLGACFGWLPPEARDVRRRDQREALDRAVREAIARRVDAILFPGDLFDRDGVDAETLAFAVHAFDVPDCPPVFIAPGNHDPWSETSASWSPRLLAARGFAWPAHVHVFTTAGWSARPLAGHPALIWGRCFTPRVESAERPLAPQALAGIAGAPGMLPGMLHIGLFHGSREDHCPPGQKVTAPFSDAEALGSPFVYLAVGHYHASARIESFDDGAPAHGPRLAYAGSAVAILPVETGTHGALEARIVIGEGRPAVDLAYIALDDRRVHELHVDVTGASSGERVDRMIEDALAEAGVSPRDIATVRLAGRLVRGVRYAGPSVELAGRAFHLRVDPRALRPDYDLEAYRREPATTTEHRFAKALLERLAHEPDPARRVVIESALYYGLDAFRLSEVRPAYEEIDA